MDALISWFDLAAPSAEVGIAAQGMSLGQQLLLYAIVVVGVLFSESVVMARSGQAISLKLNWSWVLTAAVIALVVFPALWRELGSMPRASLFVQLGLAAQSGVFWGVLMAGAEKRTRSEAASLS